MSFPILTVIIMLPIVGGIITLLLPRQIAWLWALGIVFVDLVLTVILSLQFTSGSSGFQFTEHQPWITGLSLNYSLGVDGISLFLMILTALLATVSIGVTPLLMKDLQQPRLYYALMLLLTTGIQGVFLSTNVFLFYVFWEIMLIPAYLLIGTFGGTNRSYAAIKFVIYTAIGSLLMLAGVIGLTAIGTAGGSLDLSALVGHVPANTQMLFFLAFFAAFAIKSPLFPFHSWLPDAYAEAPIPVTVMLAGAMSKTGTYGILRYCMTLFPQAVKDATPVIGSLAVAGILYCAVQAVTQQDFKRLLGYSSISHIGVVLLGLFAFNQQGIDGAVLQMVNHGITTAALFLIAGFIEVRFKSRTLREYGGLAARLPILATVFAIAALSSLGLPGLNSFAGEFLALIGAFRANIAFGVLGSLVVIPAAWYLLRFFQGVMEGQEATPTGNENAVAATTVNTSTRRPSATKASGVRDLGVAELAVLLPLIALMFIIGFRPGSLPTRIEPSVNPIINNANTIHAAPVSHPNSTGTSPLHP